MIKLTETGVYLLNGETIAPAAEYEGSPEEGREQTIAYQILRAAERPKEWSSSLMVPPTAQRELWQLVRA